MVEKSERRVEEVVKNSIDEVIGLANKKELHFDVQIEDKARLAVNADVNMLSVVLRNLLTNAIKFSNKKEQIIICASRLKTKFVQFEIRDKGVGIPHEKIYHIFDLNKTTSSSGTEGEKGTGLGLILCKEFIDYHGGKIWVESKPDQETVFFFTIPADK
jgi:signal transduction histidine kinase